MYKFRFTKNHEEAGLKRGRLFNKNNIKFDIKLDRFQYEHGIKSIPILKKYHYNVYKEVVTLANELKIDSELFLSWMLCMGCCMYNLEDNVQRLEVVQLLCLN